LLVLARRKEESILIGDDIVITVLAIEGEKVKLGIKAPNEIRILRQELHEAILEQNAIADRLVHAPEEPEAFKSLRKLLVEEKGDKKSTEVK
jgi:carbon storage regulator